MTSLEEVLAVVGAQLDLINDADAGFSRDRDLYTQLSAAWWRQCRGPASSIMGLESALRNWREGAARKITATMEAGNGVH